MLIVLAVCNCVAVAELPEQLLAVPPLAGSEVGKSVICDFVWVCPSLLTLTPDSFKLVAFCISTNLLFPSYQKLAVPVP